MAHDQGRTASTGRMNIFKSNQIEPLVDALAVSVDCQKLSPIEEVTLVVQSQGMASWVSLQLADRMGIWANSNIWFPRRFFNHALQVTLNEEPDAQDFFDRENLIWPIFDLLHELLPLDDFLPLRQYLKGDTRGIKTYQLCHRLAQMFDQYLAFRPEMLLEWEKKSGKNWQQLLWQKLVERSDHPHLAARTKDLFEQAHTANWSPFEHGVFLFGISILPPLYLRILNEMGKHVPVFLFCLTPSEEYWVQTESRGRNDLDELWEKGHPLLASLGKVGREFQELLIESIDKIDMETDLFQPNLHSHVLGNLQRDILQLKAPRTLEGKPSNHQEAPPSIQINICHGALREVEVLHQHLLHLIHSGFVNDPGEIAVLAPKMEVYAPFIAAVFPDDPKAEDFVPIQVADGKEALDFPVLSTFLGILNLVGKRMTASEILDLMSKQPIREKWEISALDLERMSTWIRASGIRWGRDSDHVRRFVDVDEPSNTWEFGIRRLFLGYAAPTEEQNLFQGVLGFDEVEGEAALSLGKMAAFVDQLFRVLETLSQPKSLSEWRCCLHDSVRILMGPSVAIADGAQHLFASLGHLSQKSETGGLKRITFDVISQHFSHWSKTALSSQRLFRGGVNFASMLSMRSIPFKVIYVLGLNDGQFPGTEQQFPFDVIKAKPKLGDRSKRDDDRYLFLETLLAARDQIVISFQGMSLKDNKSIPPSPVVDDLIDSLAKMAAQNESLNREEEFKPGALWRFRDARMVCHALHAFDRRYFDPNLKPEFFSHSASQRDSARRFLSVRKPPPAFISAPLSVGNPDENQEVNLADLERFFENPARYLLTNRLGLTLDTGFVAPLDFTSTHTDSLDTYHIGQALLDVKFTEKSRAEEIEILGAMGILPWGTAGESALHRIEAEVESLRALWGDVNKGKSTHPLEVDLPLPHGKISGILHDQFAFGQGSCRFHRLNGSRLLSLWIRHLVLVCLRTRNDRPVSALVARNRNSGKTSAELVWFDAVEDATNHLNSLVELFFIGQTEPLLFLPNSAYEFAQMAHQGKNGIRAAEKMWILEADDPYVHSVFGDASVIDPDFNMFKGIASTAGTFQNLATRIFSPLLDQVRQTQDLQSKKPKWFAGIGG